jgi:hypothetical protein
MIHLKLQTHKHSLAIFSKLMIKKRGMKNRDLVRT